MIRPAHTDAIRRSAIAWMRRLGWNYLSDEQVIALRSNADDVVLRQRLLPTLRRFVHQHDGHDLSLSSGVIEGIIDHIKGFQTAVQREAGNQSLLEIILTGVASSVTLPDGTALAVTVPLIEWAHPNRVHWDLADGVSAAGACRSPHIRDLVGYVNGLPLVLVACVERQAHGGWGHVQAGIEHLVQATLGESAHPLPGHLQVLITLSRKEGQYAGFAPAAQGWTRWREAGWNPASLKRLRAAPLSRGEGPPDLPLRIHAELLQGVTSPHRLLALLQSSVGSRKRIIRSAQFFACRTAVRHLRRIAQRGRRNDAQICLAPGTGLRQTREWLVQAVAADPTLRGLRIVRVLARAPADSCKLGTATQLATFLRQPPQAPMAASTAALRSWARTSTSTPQPGADVVLVVDADFWSIDVALLRRVRSRLPHATWLTLCACPVSRSTEGIEAGPLIYDYPRDQAVADGVVVPVWRESHVVALEHAGAATRTEAIADAICDHFHQYVLLTGRSQHAELLVDSAERAHEYCQAFQRGDRLTSVTRAMDAKGHERGKRPIGRVPPGAVVVSSGSLPDTIDPALGVLYIDRRVSEGELARAVGMLSQPGEGKRDGLLVNFHPGNCELDAIPAAAPGRSWLPMPREMNVQLADDIRHRLSRLLPLPVMEDFHACRLHLSPNWALSHYAQDRDLNRQCRHLFHEQVTRLGHTSQLAVAFPSPGDTEGSDEMTEHPHRNEMQRYSLLRDAVSHDALEQDRYSTDDTRVRHWARDLTHEVREQVLAYRVMREAEQPDDSAMELANQCYTRLRRQLEHPADEPHLQERARAVLRQVLADHPEPAARLVALTELESRIPALLGDDPTEPRSRGLRVLEGQLDTAKLSSCGAALGKRIDEIVQQSQHFRPDNPGLFRNYLQLQARPALALHLTEDEVQRVLHALLTRAPHWPVRRDPDDDPMPYGITGGT